MEHKKTLGSKLFVVFVISLLGLLLYVTVFSGGIGKAPHVIIENIRIDKPLKPIMVIFWATTCPPCIEKMPKLAKLKEKHGDDFDVIAISMHYDPKSQVERFIENNPFPFIFVQDTNGKLAEKFGGVFLTPTTFLISPNGTIVYHRVGEVDFGIVEEKLTTMISHLLN